MKSASRQSFGILAITSLLLLNASGVLAQSDLPPSLFIEAYPDRISVVAGSELAFHTSTTAAEYSLEIARIGAKREVVFQKAGIPGSGAHVIPEHASANLQGHRVSFQRPQSSLFPNWEQPFVAWAEANGYAIDYCANQDLEEHPELLTHYSLVLSVGHDEYWSSGMRDQLEAYIARGGNVAFFSGNTCCWQVRPEENGQALTCYKQSFNLDPLFKTNDQRLLSTTWSHHLVKRPENQLTGVGFLFGGYHKSHGQFMDGSGAYTVHRPDHWLFANTSLKSGDAFGGMHTIVGYECDGCELEWKDGKPFPTHRDGTPKSFEVLATCEAKWAPNDCEWYDQWEKGRVGAACLGVYTNNGTVFTCGSTDWAHGLRGGDAVVEQISRNVLAKLAP